MKIDGPGRCRRGIVRMVEPADRRLSVHFVSLPDEHTRQEIAGIRFDHDALDLQGDAALRRRVLQQQGSRAVRQHPAQKFGLERQAFAIAVTLGLKPRRLQQTADELTGDADRCLYLARPDRQCGMAQGDDAAGADPVQGSDLAGRHLQLPLHHTGKSRQRQISLRGRRDQQFDVFQIQRTLRERLPHRMGGHLCVAEDRLLVLVYRIVALRDPVLPEHTLAQRRRLAGDLPQARFHPIVADGFAGQKLPDRCKKTGTLHV
jgi:hypothetical protein